MSNINEKQITKLQTLLPTFLKVGRVYGFEEIVNDSMKLFTKDW